MRYIIQQCREQSNLTPKQLSKLLNITVHTYLAMEQGRISFRPEIVEMLSRIYQVRLTVPVMDWDIVLKKVEEAFGELNEADRFFRAMENLTGVGSYQSNYRKIASVKNDILAQMQNQLKSAPTTKV